MSDFSFLIPVPRGRSQNLVPGRLALAPIPPFWRGSSIIFEPTLLDQIFYSIPELDAFIGGIPSIPVVFTVLVFEFPESL
jgi:hypothetical protein